MGVIIKQCKSCGKVAEMIKKTEFERGWENTYWECSKCGYVEKQQINKFHYGNDEIKK